MTTQPARLKAATAATGLPAGRVRGDGRHVLDAADLEPGARQGAEGVLRAGAGGLGLVAARCPHLDVHGRDAEFLLCLQISQDVGEGDRKVMMMSRLVFSHICLDEQMAGRGMTRSTHSPNDAKRTLHLAATSCAASMAAYGDASSRSAFTFMPPVTRDSVSRPDRSVTCCGREGNGSVAPTDECDRKPQKGSPGQDITRNQHSNTRTYHEGVVEGGEDVRHAKDVLALRGLGAEVQGLRVVNRLGSSPLGLVGWDRVSR